ELLDRAPIGDRGRSHVRRPSPAGLIGCPPDAEIAESDDLESAVRHLADFVRGLEALESHGFDHRLARVILERLPAARRPGRLPVQRLPVLHASLDELRPLRDDRNGVGLLGQKAPQVRMKPAQIVESAVAVLANAMTQLPNLRDQLFTRHRDKIIVHATTPRSYLRIGYQVSGANPTVRGGSPRMRSRALQSSAIDGGQYATFMVSTDRKVTPRYRSSGTSSISISGPASPAGWSSPALSRPRRSGLSARLEAAEPSGARAHDDVRWP